MYRRNSYSFLVLLSLLGIPILGFRFAHAPTRRGPGRPARPRAAPSRASTLSRALRLARAYGFILGYTRPDRPAQNRLREIIETQRDPAGRRTHEAAPRRAPTAAPRWLRPPHKEPQVHTLCPPARHRTARSWAQAAPAWRPHRLRTPRIRCSRPARGPATDRPDVAGVAAVAPGCSGAPVAEAVAWSL